MIHISCGGAGTKPISGTTTQKKFESDVVSQVEPCLGVESGVSPGRPNLSKMSKYDPKILQRT